MSGETFSIAPEKPAEKNGLSGCAGCPLAQIPAKVWRDLLRPPFRKRHPLLFCLLLLAFALLAFSLCRLFFSDKSLMEGERIALVPITGAIMNVEPTLEWIRKVEGNPDVKGVLLRVDSPGGGASASQEVYAALARLAKKKPIAASMGATAASGGYMVSMAAGRVFANPSTVTGSIGVRMDIPQLQNLMGKLGIGQETLVTGPYKDAASYLRPLSPRDREYLQRVLEDMHRQFVEIVAKGRKMPLEKAASLANGKIYTGQEALALGLVDELGGQDEAMAWLARQTGVPASRRLLKKKEGEKDLLRSLLARVLGIEDSWLKGMEDLPARLSTPVFLYQF